jgi:P4 family phage/plasmid primase-like protien
MSKLVSLQEFLKAKRVVVSEKPYNLTTLYSSEYPIGKYYINEDEREAFLEVYYNHVFIKNKFSCCLERPFSIANRPFLENSLVDANIIKIDLDLRHDLTKDEEKQGEPLRRYTQEQLESLIQTYISKFNEYIHIPKDMKFYLMEKEAPKIIDKNGKRLVKDGIHIIASNYLVPNAILHKVRNEILEDPEVIELFEDIKINVPLKDVIDKSVIQSNNWFLYGSGKPDDFIYKVSKTYSSTSGLIRIIENSVAIDIIKDTSHLYPRKNIKVRESCALDEMIKVSANENASAETQARIRSEMRKLGTDKSHGPQSEVFSPEYIKKLIDCLDPSRAKDYTEWWKIGQSLYNIDCRNGHIFIDFSRRGCEKFNEDSCKDHWLTKFAKDSFKYSALHMSHLRKMAAIDNYPEYAKLEKIYSTKVMDEILNTFRQPMYEKKLGETTLSKHVKKYLDTNTEKQYVCVVGDRGARQWFTFEHNKWKKDDGGANINAVVSGDLLTTFIKTNANFHLASSNLHTQIIENNSQGRTTDPRSDEGSSDEIRMIPDDRNQNAEIVNLQLEQSSFQEKANVAKRIVEYLEDTHKRETLIKNLGFLYNDPDFYNKIDTNQLVFVCKNGVLDLSELVFRPGRPEDMMTKSCRVNYITMDDIVSNPQYQEYAIELQDFLDQIQPDSDVQGYLLDVVAECLCGIIRREEIYFCEGFGSNGKSKFFDFLDVVFGDYAGKSSTTILTKGRDSPNAPTPAIVDLCGKRIVSCQEPDENAKISTGVMKELSGADKLTGRQLNMPLKTFVPTHRIFISCNDKPDIDSTDEGTWRRIRNIKFGSKFLDANDPKLDDPETFPHHYKKDRSIAEKFSKWAPIMLCNLFERFKNLAKRNFNIIIPDEVNLASREYKDQQNIYASFVRDRMVDKRNEAPKERLEVKAAFGEFINYAKESNFKMAGINKNTFQMNVERIMETKSSSGKWKGWNLATYVTQETQDSETEIEGVKKKIAKQQKQAQLAD